MREDKRLYSEINEILFRFWDPIGMNDVLPRDEYEDYVGPVFRALVNGKSEKGLIDLLTSFENEIGSRARWKYKVDTARRLLSLTLE